MCSRQVFAAAREIAERLGLDLDGDNEGMDNAAPTDLSPIITLQEPKKLQYFKWGLPWYSHENRPVLTTCIRAETAFKKYGRMFSGKKRCISISKGFFEFSKVMKEPFFFAATDQPYTIIAALYDNSPDLKTGEYENRYAILTIEPNDLVAKTHDRMPVILTPEAQLIWLNPEATNEELASLFVAYDQENMDVKVASKDVNNSKNKNFKLKDLRDPKDVPPPPEQGTLF